VGQLPHELLGRVEVVAGAHIRPNSRPDTLEVVETLGTEFPGIGVRPSWFSGLDLLAEPMPALAFPLGRCRLRATPPAIAAGLDHWALLLPVSLHGVAVGALGAPTRDVVGDWPTAAIWAEFSERRLGSRPG